MATAIGILLIVFAFVVLIITIRGMRDPKSYGNKDMPSSQILKTNSIIILVLLSVSTYLFNSPYDMTRQAGGQNNPEFSFTVNEFVRRYNQSVEKINTRSIAIAERQEVSDGISYKLTKGIHNKEFNLSVTTNKNSDKVRSITYMINLVSADTSVEVLLRFTATIMAVENPNMLPEDRGRRLTEVGVLKIVEDKQTIITRKNNIEYKVDLIEEIATFILSIKPSEGRYN